MTEKSPKSYDVLVIGAGPGGYVAAIRCAQLGMSVAVAEKMKTLGGTCLNIGCIPSKALLHASEKYTEAENHLGDFGVKVGKVALDMKAFMGHKHKVVEANTKGIEFLFKKNKIDWIKGTAKLLGEGKVSVSPPLTPPPAGGKKTAQQDSGGEHIVSAKHILIATGSSSIDLPGIEVDEKTIVSSTGALELSAVPKTMAVIGGGYIGLEMAAVWSRLGAKVTVIEFLDRILPGMDGEISKEMQKILTKQGIDFKLNTKVAAAKKSAKGVDMTLEPAKGGKGESMKADILLVAVGRKAYTDGLGLENVGVETDDRGRIKVDHRYKTNIEGIYAFGDVIAGPMLAHKAEEEGVLLAEMLAGQWGEKGAHFDHNLIPGVVYTWPEAAQIGKTEQQLKEEGVKYKVGKFPFMANGRARAMNATDGFVKILADERTDRVLGAHIIGPEAGTLIAEVAAVMEFGGTAEDIARTCHAHPTLEEVVKEAALAVHGRPVHI